MSMFERVLAMVVAATAMGAAVTQAGGPELGRPATPEEVAAWDISIAPDGANLPAGGGTATEGAAVYQEKCLSCHGEAGAGGEGLADPLVGGVGTLAGDQPVKTVGSYWPYATTLFDYVRRAMPYNAPLSLTDDEVYAVSAYILAENGVIGADAMLDAETLAQVRMPNRDGFVPYWPPRE